MTTAVVTDEHLNEELDRLRAEVESLKGRKRERIRRAWSWILLGFGVLVALLSSLAVFVDQTLLDTNEYVATVTELTKEPEIVQAATAVAVEDLVDRDALIEEIGAVLPEELGFAAGPLVSGLESGVQELAADIAGTSEFTTIWSEANRLAHQEAIAVLRGEGTEPLVIKDGAVTLDLSDLANEISSGLGPELSSMLPVNDVAGQVTLFQDDQLGLAQNAVTALDTGALLLPLAAVLVIGLGWWLANDRRRYLVVAGISVATGLLLVVGLTDVARTEVTGALDESYRAAVDSAWNVIGGRYAIQAALVGMFALLVALAAWLSDPTRRPQVTDNATFKWIAEHSGVITGVIVGIAILTIVFWPHPTTTVALAVFLIGAVLLTGTRLVSASERN